MPLLLIVLFYRNRADFGSLKQKQPLVWITAFSRWIIPWLNLFGYMDDFFSAKLFSGKTQYLFICTSNPQAKKIFAPYFASSISSSACDSSLSVFKWGIKEMNVPPNPEIRILKNIMQQWEEKYDTAHADKYLILNPKFSEEKWKEIYPESK